MILIILKLKLDKSLYSIDFVAILFLNAFNDNDRKKELYELYVVDTKNSIVKFNLKNLYSLNSHLLKSLSENYIVKGSIRNFSGKRKVTFNEIELKRLFYENRSFKS